jgi:TonB family protein
MRSFLFVLLLTAPALAQPSQQDAQAPAPGYAHICAMYYPRSAIRMHEQGVTTLEYSVTPQGRVANITVKKSSGHSSLDGASVTCVQQWLYPPTMENGVPIEVSKQAKIEWSLDSRDPLPSLLQRAAQDCIAKAHPSDEALAKASAMTLVKIQFYRSDPPSAEIASSSGNEGLDKLVVGCLGQLPPNISVHPPFRLGYLLPFSWKTGASLGQSAPSPEAPR